MREDLAIAFGQVIQRLREERDWSQEKLAEEARRSRNLIARFEQGRSRPTVESLWDIAGAFDLRPGEVVDLAEDQLARNRRSRTRAKPRQVGRPRKQR